MDKFITNYLAGRARLNHRRSAKKVRSWAPRIEKPFPMAEQTVGERSKEEIDYELKLE